MSAIIASPCSYDFSYSALFSVPKIDARKQRPPSYFWDKAIDPPAPAPAAPVVSNDLAAAQTNSTWLDDDSKAVSESEDEDVACELASHRVRHSRGFSRIRQIAFRAFVPKVGSEKPSTVIATEIVSQKKVSTNNPLAKKDRGPGFTLFNSWRFKTKGVNTQVRKLAAVFRNRISSRSPESQKPKTWEEYNRFYGAGEIDINDPPLPPMEPNAEEPTPFQNTFYMAPNADDEPVRQLAINRLGVFGKAGFDLSDDGAARTRARVELAERLEREGTAPKTLTQGWEHPSSGLELVPDTLEQHPVLMNIVRHCREMFKTPVSALSIMDADRQIFLADSGLDGCREAPRAVTACAHTVLSGRKGFTILDTLSDWRFSSSPGVKFSGTRFYAGVPLMAPNLDGTSESEDAARPLGTLCIVDVNPRESFGIEDRKKLCLIAEYARREIGLWFKSKMAQKTAALEESHKTFVQEVDVVDDEPMGQQAEILTEEPNRELADSSAPSPDKPHEAKKRGFRRFGSSSSLASTPSTTPSSGCNSFFNSSRLDKPCEGPSLFDDPSPAVKPKMQKVFDLAAKLMGESLDLSLVYLLAVKPHDYSTSTGQTLLLSGHNLPSPLPSFSAGLHLSALRAPEGGILYQNPTPQQAQDAALMPKLATGSNPYASALLVRVGEESHPTAGGFVMAGFTNDIQRVFGAEDVMHMKQFAAQVDHFTSKLKL